MTALIVKPSVFETYRHQGENFYGLAVFSIDREEYGVGTIAQAEIAARCLVRDCLDVAEAEVIIKYSTLPPEAIKLVEYIRGDCWAAEQNEMITVLVSDMNGLVEETIATKGRASILCMSGEPVERSLMDFPDECRAVILNELGPVDPCSIYLYKFG